MQKILLLFFGFLLTLGSFAQQTSVKGVVTSADDGLTMPGVTILEKGTMNGTTTNIDGVFQINVP
ncbi:MAG TPA: carboxypeptidase-like regulatory domain-containing protein, partial [Draconibacterium sp.]|nr:carboxypeptidase-like regulatory domain-containing protein [Draconibacterium sp.]